jgi:hypothetical protein
MSLIQRRMREISARPDNLPLDELTASNEPAILRGVAEGWGITRAGRQSELTAMDYIRSFYNGRPTHASIGAPGIRGRLFYEDDLSKLNFESERVQLDQFLDRLAGHLEDELPPTMYIGSLLVDTHLPGFRRENDLAFAARDIDAPPAIWIGNRTVASCHYDAPYNIACCVVGRRRFTVFPPDQIFNLYPGPLEPTPGGQAISLVDFNQPDFSRFPNFRQAIEAGLVADLEPGDAVFIPSMWWHHVEGLSRFNTLVNYWWNRTPQHIPTPMNALYHAIWSLRDRPENEKRAWRNVFEYYVFGERGVAGDHLPPAARGPLGPIDENQARRIRALLINKLNR